MKPSHPAPGLAEALCVAIAALLIIGLLFLAFVVTAPIALVCDGLRGVRRSGRACRREARTIARDNLYSPAFRRRGLSDRSALRCADATWWLNN